MPAYLWVGCFAALGAIIGFFVLREAEISQNKRKEFLKSLAAGVFTALITYAWCTERWGWSHTLSMMVAGGIAFGGTDAAILMWKKLFAKVEKDD